MKQNDQGMKFYVTTEFLKYAGKFWKICRSNMQQNIHFYATIFNFMQ